MTDPLSAPGECMHRAYLLTQLRTGHSWLCSIFAAYVKSHIFKDDDKCESGASTRHQFGDRHVVRRSELHCIYENLSFVRYKMHAELVGASIASSRSATSILSLRGSCSPSSASSKPRVRPSFGCPRVLKIDSVAPGCSPATFPTGLRDHRR
ncbi:hypothetical protein ASPFODRAFT_557382 [Aspergillus luchuensis CBS 106.47]|uniref:Uncharacterized protein n=1 Tax=Aspergillus luchuensis (strain CBS 106.47) TaxID=1137211 RepID=A0A1M3SYQ2_ASPLC|nr:hypothetical protein ASPFODRAFT_557382 [Aspergillus luchuensis CBS 106.47]